MSKANDDVQAYKNEKRHSEAIGDLKENGPNGYDQSG